MPADDSLLGQNLVDLRNEERRARWEDDDPLGLDPGIPSTGQELRHLAPLQLPACDRCSLGVMDATNSHYLGTCSCDCHAAPLALCTQDAQCAADVDAHLDGCPVEQRLRKDFGF